MRLRFLLKNIEFSRRITSKKVNIFCILCKYNWEYTTNSTGHFIWFCNKWNSIDWHLFRPIHICNCIYVALRKNILSTQNWKWKWDLWTEIPQIHVYFVSCKLQIPRILLVFCVSMVGFESTKFNVLD